MTEISIIIPIAPYHESVADRAIESAQLQTMPCEVIYVNDRDGKGPAWARNTGLRRCFSEFVVFLDADDWIEPTFVEDCLRVWEPDHYVYTDWRTETEVHHAPDDPWCDSGHWHPITSLIPKATVDHVRGFATLQGGEDTEFYWALTRKARCCGIHLPKPLFHYMKDGQRGRHFRHSDDYESVMRGILREYGHMSGCCGDPIRPGQASNEKQDGDVLAACLWRGNRHVLGVVSQRLYPRASLPMRLWVHPADVAAMPNMFKGIPIEIPPQKPVEKFEQQQQIDVIHAEGFDEVRRAIFGGQRPEQTLEKLEAADVADVEPDIDRISNMAKRHYG